jgi:hypothetical protein
MRHEAFLGYSYAIAGTYPTEKERGGQMLHPDFDHGWGRERVARMREEVEHNRLVSGLGRGSRSANGVGLGEESGFRRSAVARATTFATALFK